MADEIREYKPVAPADLPVKFRDMGDGTYAQVFAVDFTPPVVDAADVASVTVDPDSASDALVVSANPSRKGLILLNDSKKSVYLRFGTSPATSSDYTLKLGSQEEWIMPKEYYTGAIHGVWDADSSGSLRVTEIT